MLENKHRSWSERWPVKQWRATKIKLARWLLEYLEPDQARVIGETVEQAIADKTKEWEIALLELQFHIHNDFRGILHEVPSVKALCLQIDNLSRAYSVEKLRRTRLIDILDIKNEGHIVSEVKQLKEIDHMREAEKEQIREAFQMAIEAKDLQMQSQAVLYNLRKKYDHEDKFDWQIPQTGRKHTY